MQFSSFGDFYHFYLGEHRKFGTRFLHFLGTSFFLLFLGLAISKGNGWLVCCGVMAAYGLAWFSHFFIEKNRPATFRYPFYSLAGDFRMFFELLTGRLPFRQM
jgi:hypothetical protein